MSRSPHSLATSSHSRRARGSSPCSRAARPAATDELAERLGLHPNGVRVHLERLAGDGLVERAREREGAADRATHGRSHRSAARRRALAAYADLGRWLARAITSGRRVTAIEAHRARDRARAGADAARPARREALPRVLAALGFQPRRDCGGRPDGSPPARQLPLPRRGARERRRRLHAAPRDHPGCSTLRRARREACALRATRPRPRGLRDRAQGAGRR